MWCGFEKKKKKQWKKKNQLGSDYGLSVTKDTLRSFEFNYFGWMDTKFVQGTMCRGLLSQCLLAAVLLVLSNRGE